jgi:hypothetical protein
MSDKKIFNFKSSSRTPAVYHQMCDRNRHLIAKFIERAYNRTDQSIKLLWLKSTWML